VYRSLSFLVLFFLSCSVCHADAHPLVNAARYQIGRTVEYDPSYTQLKYPGGDVPMNKGVCTDVLIRALRQAYNVDLQVLVHDDMKQHFSHYPKQWGLSKTDSNIDHRRVPNLQTYFKRSGYNLPVSQNAKDFLPGDIVTVTIPPNLPHIMIVSDKKSWSGTPMVIHNIGQGTREEDRLFEFPMTGHFRMGL